MNQLQEGSQRGSERECNERIPSDGGCKPISSADQIGVWASGSAHYLWSRRWRGAGAQRYKLLFIASCVAAIVHLVCQDVSSWQNAALKEFLLHRNYCETAAVQRDFIHVTACGEILSPCKIWSQNVTGV